MSMIEQEHPPDSVQPDNSKHRRLDSFEDRLQPEMRLETSERYGWWKDHDADENRNVAAVHGAVNNFRTDILLDSGASVSMVSLDLARRFKLKLKFCKQLRVSGLGGVPTIITASTEVKITLGPRVVYILELWVANIGEGVDALLGMNFMYSAGVRLRAREGLVQLPDEEPVLLSGRGMSQRRQGLDLPVQPPESLYLGPGDHAVVRIKYGQINPQREVVWAGRGDRWVTQIIYAAKGWPFGMKVVNVSKKFVWIDTRTAVARVIEHGFFPQDGHFVRPGRQRYREWETLIDENTNLARARLREEREAQALQDPEPPCVQKPDYAWPSKLLTRPPCGTDTFDLVQLQARPKQLGLVRAKEDVGGIVEPPNQDTKMPPEFLPKAEVGSDVGPKADSADKAPVKELCEIVPEEDAATTKVLVKTVEPDKDFDGDVDSDGDLFYDTIPVEEDVPSADDSGSRDPKASVGSSDPRGVPKKPKLIVQTSSAVRNKSYSTTDPIGPLTLLTLRCGSLFQEFIQGSRARARLRTMYSGDNHPSA
jgi:hypothetical protein